MTTPDNSFGGADVDDLMGGTTPSGHTILDSLNDALAAAIAKEPVVTKVPLRPNIRLQFDPNIEFELFQEWVKKAQKAQAGKKSDGTIDYLRMSLMVLSHTNSAILFNGVVADGLTIKSQRVHEMLKVPAGSVGPAIRKLFGSDGHVIQTMRRVIEAAGYTLDGDVEDVEDSDPLGI